MTTPPWCREKVMVYYYYYYNFVILSFLINYEISCVPIHTHFHNFEFFFKLIKVGFMNTIMF